MNVSTAGSTSTDYHLAFRQAANDGKTDTMIQLKNEWAELDINSSGATSLQTAAHRAASKGHVAVLRLLYNLGADFSCTDKDGHTAKHYANSDGTRKFFTEIAIAHQALAERDDFFSNIVDTRQCSRDEFNTLRLIRDTLQKDELQDRRQFQKALICAYDTETFGMQDTLKQDVIQSIVAKINAALEHVGQWARTKTILEHAIQTGRELASCGEVARTCFLNLTQRMHVADVECVTLAVGSTTQNSLGHSFNILNRDRSQALDNLNSWKSAFIIDAQQRKSFYYQFVKEYPQSTCLKSLNVFNVVAECSSIDAPITDFLTKTIAFYQQQLATLKQSSLALYEQRRAARNPDNLAFRQAANDGNTNEMIRLKDQKTELNINSSGIKSLQTAAHRAAAQGQVAALRLLYNLGANLDLTDSKGKKAQDYAKTAEIRDFFATVEIAKQAQAERCDFFNNILLNETTREVEAIRALRQSLYAQTEAVGQSLMRELGTKYKAELKEKTNNVVISFEQEKEINAAIEQLYCWSRITSLLEHSTQTNREMVSCGEVAKACFVNLAQRKRIANVECVTVSTMFQSNLGHTFNVLGRDQSQKLSNLDSWKSAFIIDSQNEKSFFYEFVNEYTRNTSINNLSLFDFTLEGASIDVPISEFFPNTKAWYEEKLATLKQRSLTLYQQRLASRNQKS